jgi:hypothetical protein
MRKLFILSLLAMMIAIGGCGSGGTSADPLGTDSIMFADAAGSAAPQVNPNGAMSLKATVKNAAGVAVVGREVSFGFVSNASGATLASSSANTDGAGEATILYRAGATAGFDVVRAFISNGAKMDLNITVGSPPTGAGGQKISLTGSPTSLAAGKNSILTATVTDSSGNLSSGQAVTFAFVTPTTIGSTITTITGVTDGSGRAVAVYTAGSTGTASVEETIQATIDGSADLMTLTRTAGGTAAGYSMALAATATSLKAGESSVITATVTNTVTGSVASGQPVTFAFVAPTTIGSTLTTLNGTTDGSGRAIAVYTAGATGTASIQETVKATVGTIGVDASTGTVTLTRTTAVIAGYSIAIAQPPTTSLKAGESAVITATVTNTVTGSVANGQPVTFAFVAPSTIGSTLITVNGTTDGKGQAVAVYTAGPTGTGSVQEVIRATVGTVGVDGSTDAVVMTRTVGGSGGVGISLSLTTGNNTRNISLAAGESTIITAAVNDATGNPVPGQLVKFGFLINNSGATLASLNVTTDARGKAETVYTAGDTEGKQDIVQATVSIGGVATTADAVVITVGKLSQTITFGAAPAVIVGGTGTVSATATSGLAVTFSSLTTGVCTISGGTVTGVTAGTCTIAANQSGNANYNAAPEVTQNITVGP